MKVFQAPNIWLEQDINIILQSICTIIISIPYFSSTLRHSYPYPLLREILIATVNTCYLEITKFFNIQMDTNKQIFISECVYFDQKNL